MQRSLQRLTQENTRSHVQGTALAKSHGESFTRLRESVSKTSEVFRREFAPVFKSVAEEATGLRFSLTGIGGAAAAAVGGASAMAFSFAGTARSLRDLSQSTGMSVNDLRVFEQIGPRIGSSVEAMDGGLQSLNAHMERLKRNGFAELASMTGSMFPDVKAEVAKLAGLSRPEQFERLLDIAERIKQNPGRGGGEANERQFLQFFGLPPELAEYSGKIRDVVAQIRQNLKPLSADQIMMGLEASVAWSNLQLRMKGFSDYVGATFAPVLKRAMDGIGAEFATLESGATGWIDKIKADPAIARSWDDISTRVGADIKSLIDGLSTFDDTATRPRVLPAPLAPGWVGVGQDIKNLIGDADQMVRLVDALNAKKVDWSLVFDLSGFKQMRENFEQSLAPGGFWHKFREFFDSINARAGIVAPPVDAAAPTRPAPPHTPTPSGPVADPSVLIKNAWAWIRHNWQADAPPTAPATPPPSLPPIAPAPTPPPFTFHKPEIGPPIPKLPFAPIAYNPDEGKPGAAMGGASSSRGDAVSIIAAGTRKGVADGMCDFWQTLKGMKERAGLAGVTPASFEPGSGGLGGGAGGLGGSLRGTGGGSGLPDAAGGGKGSGRFMDELARIESGNKNIYSGVDPDVAGPNSRSQGYFQINTPTWRDFAGKAGVDLSKYPDAMHSPRDVQEKVASVIPLSRFGPRTRRTLGQEFGPLDVHKPVGQLGPQDTSSLKDAASKLRDGLRSLPLADPTKTGTGDYAGLKLKSQESVAGGPAERGLAALAHHEQDSEGKNFSMFSALRDKFHIFENPSSFHNRGLAFDATTKDRDYDAARERMRSYLNNLGFKEGDLQGRSGDYAIEPGTRDHLHAQFNSREASERYYSMVAGKADKYASLHDRPPMQGQHALAKHGEALREMFGHRGEQKDRSLGQEVRREPGSLLRASDQRMAQALKHEVTGSASLHVKLAAGLAPASGVKTKGGLFKEVRLDRAPLPLASTTG
jgi:hypothetical protein